MISELNAESGASVAPDDSAWFRQEVLPHGTQLGRYLRLRFPSLSDPEDILQETFMRILRVRRAGETVRTVKPLLFHIARNLALSQIRRRAAAPFVEVACESVCIVAAEEPSVGEAVSRRHEVEILREAIQELPPRCREVMRLRIHRGFTNREVAARMGIAAGTAENQFRRGYDFCRDYLHERCVAQRATSPRPVRVDYPGSVFKPLKPQNLSF